MKLRTIFNWSEVERVVKKDVKKKKSVIYGARAMNAQLPGFLSRPTKDFDIYAKAPKKNAGEIEKQLDRSIAQGRDEFYVKAAVHPGTWKVKHEGYDGRRGTEDDIHVADYTKKPVKLPTKTIKGVQYERLTTIEKGKRKILADQESRYRHAKDKYDLMSIKAARVFRMRG